MFNLPWLKGWKGVVAGSAALYLILYLFWVLFLFKQLDPYYAEIINGLAYLPMSIVAAYASFYASDRQLTNTHNRAWKFIGAGLLSASIADVIYVTLNLTIGVGFPDIPDFFYLLYYPLIFIGLFTIPTQSIDLAQQKTAGIDVATITLSIIAILWYFIIAPTALTGGETWAAQLVAGAYPSMDTFIIASLTRILFQRSEPNTRNALSLLGIGLFIYVIGDVLYAQTVLAGTYYAGSWVDIFFMTFYFFAMLAGLRQSHTSFGNEQRKTDEKLRSSSVASILLYSVVSVSIATSLYVVLGGNDIDLRAIGLIVLTTVAVFLVLIKQIIVNRENGRLIEELQNTSDQLRDTSILIEQRGTQRTRELELQAQQLRRASQIARDAASARDLQTLLNKSTTLLLEQYNAIHTAIFLLDQKEEYVVLSASPTEAGQKLMAENYKVQVGEASILGRVAVTREPINIRQIDQTIRENNKSLQSSANSAIALPLKVENALIGILDIQSETPDAFQQDDLTILQILADQLATAIERSRLLQQVEQNLNELERVYGRYTQEGWQNIGQQAHLKNRGYRFDNIRIEPLNSLPEVGVQALATGQVVNANTTGPLHEVAIPIQLRGQTIGVVNVKLKEGYSENTITTLQLTIERLASALESARLYEEANLRADREQAISQITSAINVSNNYEDILRATVREVGNMLNDSEVTIQILDEKSA